MKKQQTTLTGAWAFIFIGLVLLGLVDVIERMIGVVS